MTYRVLPKAKAIITLALLAVTAIIFVAYASTSYATTATIITAPPSSISVGDSEIVNLTFKVFLSQVTSTSPTVAMVLTVAGVNQSYFRTASITYDILITHLGSVLANVTNATSLYYNASSTILQLSTYYTGALPYTNVNLTIALHVKSAKVCNVSTRWNYRLVISSGSQAYLLTKEGSIIISILPKPPLLNVVKVEPSPSILVPGIPVNVSVLSSDASNVSSISLTLVNSSGKAVSEQVIRPLKQAVLANFTISTSDLPEGNYTLRIVSSDGLNISAVKELNLTLTRTFIVPSTYFRDIEDVLNHPGFREGSAIVLKGKVTELKTVNITIPNISISGGKDALIESNASVALLLHDVRNVTISNIAITCGGTVFKLVKSTDISIVGVKASGKKFIDITAPLNNVLYWNATIVNSSLNNRPVLYSLGGGLISNASYAETHLLFGNYVLNNVVLGNMYAINSSITAYDSPATSINLTYSNMSRYWSLTIKVLFAGSPVSNAIVKISNNVTNITLTTGKEGAAKTYLLSEKYVNGVKTLSAGPTTVTATKLAFEDKTVVVVNKTTLVTLNLPAPKCSVRLISLSGVPVSVVKPGEMLKVAVNASVTTVYNVKVEILENGEVTSIITKQTLLQHNVFLIIPSYNATNLKVKVYVCIAGMPPIKLETQEVGVSK